jgi:hypothetical protein
VVGFFVMTIIFDMIAFKLVNYPASENFYFFITITVMCILGFVALKFKQKLLTFITAGIGAYLIVRGPSLIFGGYPS